MKVATAYDLKDGLSAANFYSLAGITTKDPEIRAESARLTAEGRAKYIARCR